MYIAYILNISFILYLCNIYLVEIVSNNLTCLINSMLLVFIYCSEIGLEEDFWETLHFILELLLFKIIHNIYIRLLTYFKHKFPVEEIIIIQISVTISDVNTWFYFAIE